MCLYAATQEPNNARCSAPLRNMIEAMNDIQQWRVNFSCICCVDYIILNYLPYIKNVGYAHCIL